MEILNLNFLDFVIACMGMIILGVGVTTILEGKTLSKDKTPMISIFEQIRKTEANKKKKKK